MGWILFWVAAVVVLALLWFSPYLRRRARSGSSGAPGRTDGRTFEGLREAERARGLSGGGPGGWGDGGGGGGY